MCAHRYTHVTSTLTTCSKMRDGYPGVPICMISLGIVFALNNLAEQILDHTGEARRNLAIADDLQHHLVQVQSFWYGEELRGS